MISILRDSNTAQSVINAFNEMTSKIGISDFASLFSVVLTDYTEFGITQTEVAIIDGLDGFKEWMTTI